MCCSFCTIVQFLLFDFTITWKLGLVTTIELCLKCYVFMMWYVLLVPTYWNKEANFYLPEVGDTVTEAFSKIHRFVAQCLIDLFCAAVQLEIICSVLMVTPTCLHKSLPSWLQNAYPWSVMGIEVECETWAASLLGIVPGSGRLVSGLSAHITFHCPD